MDTGGHAGFGTTSALADALETLADLCVPHERTESVSTAAADGRVLAAPVSAARAIPHYERAAADGWAVQAADTADAAEGSPIRLESSEDAVDPGTAVRVHAGNAIPEGADAVVGIEAVDRRMEGLAVYEAVAQGENVAPVGDDVPAGEVLFEAGRRLSPADLALCRGTGVTDVAVREHPRVAVIPTGEELVAGDVEPAPGETVETNGLLVAQYCERWGADPSARDLVTDDVDAIVDALERDADHDLVVTVGGSAVGQRDLVPRAVREVGEMHVHGVDVEPGHPVGIGTLPGPGDGDGPTPDTPVVTLPGHPVSCLVNAVQCIRPAVGWLLDSDPPDHPTTTARLAGPLPSEVGTRSFARVRFVRRDDPALAGTGTGDGLGRADDDLPRVEPVRSDRGGVLSSVAAADGWVEVPESADGLPAEATVTVQHWNRCP